MTTPPPVSPVSAASLEDQLRAALAPQLSLVRLIGEGGMARVYLARDVMLKRLVAVKVLSPEIATPENRARFEREAQAVAALSHPNIVAIHTVGELADGTPYFVMPFVEGKSFAARIAEEGPLSVGDARRAIGEIASALAAAHAQGIIHRDIKPANVLYEQVTGRALVSDFGIAAVEPKRTSGESLRLTGTGVAIGSPMYMSPEQLLLEPASEKTDVYALGLLAFEMLVGRGPFKATTAPELIAAHLRDVPPRVSTIRPEIDAEFDELIARMLDKDAAKRPTAAEIARRLGSAGEALLEWPPPGLDALTGELRHLARHYWAASVCMLAWLVPAMLAGHQLGPASLSAVSLFLALIAVLGLAAFSRAMRRTVRRGRSVTDAIRGGYGWITVLETLSDPRGDTGQLIAGAREYAGVEPRRRDRLRASRVAAAALLFVSGAFVVPLCVLVIILAPSGLAGPSSMMILIALAVGAAVVGLVLDARESLTFASRRHGRAIPPIHLDLAALAAPWYESFETVRDGQALGRGTTSRASLGRVCAYVAAVAAIAAALSLMPLVLLQAVGPMFWTVATPRFSTVSGKLEIANTARGSVLPRDSAISPLAAGHALDVLMRSAGDGPPSKFAVRPLAVSLGTLPWKEPIDASLFPAAQPGQGGDLPNATKIIALTVRGVSPVELAYLSRVAHSALWSYVDTVARAPSMDYAGAHYVIPFADTAGGMSSLPLPRSTIKLVAYAGVTRAAYYLAAGKRDSAELSLRQILSMGFSIADNANSLIEEWIGIVISGIGRQGLIDYYTAIGDPRGRTLEAKRDSVIAVLDLRSAQQGPTGTWDVDLDWRDPAVARAQAIQIVNDRNAPRGVRQEMLMALGGVPCTNVREMVFGPDEDVQRGVTRARQTWTRFASDSALLDLALDSPRRIAYGGSGRPATRALYEAARMSGALLHNPRVPGCVAMMLYWLGN